MQPIGHVWFGGLSAGIIRGVWEPIFYYYGYCKRVESGSITWGVGWSKLFVRFWTLDYRNLKGCPEVIFGFCILLLVFIVHFGEKDYSIGSQTSKKWKWKIQSDNEQAKHPLTRNTWDWNFSEIKSGHYCHFLSDIYVPLKPNPPTWR